MSSLLARLGQGEVSRVLSRNLCRPGKRKRDEWVCKRCRVQDLQRRRYGGGSLRWGEETLPAGSVGDGEVGGGDRVDRVNGRRRSFWTSEAVEHGDGNQEWALQRQQRYDGEEGKAARAAEQVEDEEREVWEGLERAENHDERVMAPLAQEVALSRLEDTFFQDLDYASTLPQALQRSESVLTARCLFAASRANDREFIRSLSEETFSSILRLLEPTNSLNEFAAKHMDLSEVARKHSRLTRISDVAREHSELVMDVLYVRRNAGMLPTFADYKVLLRGARDLGDLNMTKMLWRHLEADGHVPDTACHNYRMASYVDNGRHALETRHKLRVVPYHMKARKADEPESKFQNYRVQHAGRHGIRDTVMDLFREMSRSGAGADEETFCIVMTAAAREGEMSTVKSILRKVWNMDVDALVSGTSEEDMMPTSYEPDSPLHPTDRLLHTVAHAFSINNDIAMAMRLADWVARSYNVEISQETWAQLTEWVFVLSAPRTGRQTQTDGSRTGQLDKQALMGLWNTMTGAPYHVRPTMGMYHFLIRNLTYRDLTAAALEKVEEALRVQRENVREAGERWEAFRKSVEEREQGLDETSVSLERHLREWETADLVRARDQFWGKQWMRMLLATLRGTGRGDVSEDLALRDVPRMVGEYARLLPSRTWYQTKAGLIELSMRTPSETNRNQVQLAVRRFERDRVLQKARKHVGESWMRRAGGVLPKRLDTPEMLDAVARMAMR